ncbi:zinc metalloprotease [Fulvivirga sp. 29W222]|uniref:Zinc metalloprotease n=1 Tax=Fulvivirga marina TaxID=2494733 RepID=A0A937FWZ3_9BACT|nr:zinc metalloprotease [Fulvivirga marina]MBL6446563.1 zinc metalloprotease [Fulvivirga marina]
MLNRICGVILLIVPCFVYGQKSRCLVQQEQPINNAYKHGHGSTRLENEVLTINVVVHVVYSTDEQNIPDEQIHSQINALNRDYRRLNTDASLTLEVFKSVAADAGILFKLASSDPLGYSTNGITRTFTDKPFFEGDNSLFFDSLGGKNVWDTRRYLNIYVTNLADSFYGFGTFPGTDSLVDGVAIDYKAFGTQGNLAEEYSQGRTATHEIGHWLGLTHLWGDGQSCDVDDGLSDTPLQEAPSAGCDLGKTSCGTLDMVQNFMDLSDDSCMNLFTKGQALLMHENLKKFRSDVITSSIVLSSKNIDKQMVKIHFAGNEIVINSSQLIYAYKIVNLTGLVFVDKKRVGRKTINIPLSNDISGSMLLIHIEGQHGYTVSKLIIP